MMKKKILIVNKSFELGGIQTALANMLESLHNDYDITLAVFYPVGPFRNRVPSDVKILELSPLVSVLGMNAFDCKKNGSLGQKLFKYLGGVWAKIFGNALPVKIALMCQKHIGEYDTVISYHQETSSKTLLTGFGEFALKKTKSANKIAWIHADFMATGLATKKNLRTYRKFDKIICVSQTCMNSFVEAYPELKNQCDYCYNFVPSQRIIKESLVSNNVFERSDDTIILFSACRLVEEKGLIPAIINLIPVWNDGIKLKWYIAGEGIEREKIEKVILENNLGDKVILLGFQPNPYPFIREATYLFLPSLHETFSMVVSEAHVLGTPVIATDIPIMREILNENDVLCPNGDFCKSIRNLKPTNIAYVSYDADSMEEKRFEEIIGKC